jgi:hypothetical protein
MNTSLDRGGQPEFEERPPGPSETDAEVLPTPGTGTVRNPRQTDHRLAGARRDNMPGSRSLSTWMTD